MNHSNNNVSALTDRHIPTWINVAKALAPIVIAAPIAVNLWLLEVLPWGWVLALSVVSLTLSGAIYEDLRDLYFAPRYSERNMVRAARKTYAWSLGFLPGLLWMLCGASIDETIIRTNPSKSRLHDEHEINGASGYWISGYAGIDGGGNLKGWSDN
jgi:hypothetical protein